MTILNNNKEKTGFYIVVSAPSGTGKTSLCRALLAKYPSLRFAISHTSRAPREGEENGRDYHFLSAEEFRHKITAGDFVEWVEYYGSFYGTSRTAVSEALRTGGGVVFDVEPRGARALKEFFTGVTNGMAGGAADGGTEGRAGIGDTAGNIAGSTARGAFVFIMPPSLAELARRLRGRRSESDEQVKKRLAQAQSEIAEAQWYDHTIVNDDFATALAQLEKIYISLK